MAVDRTGRGGGREPGFWAPIFSFAGFTGTGNIVLQGLPGPKNTVLQSYREKTIKTYFGPKYFLSGIFFNPLNLVEARTNFIEVS